MGKHCLRSTACSAPGLRRWNRGESRRGLRAEGPPSPGGEGLASALLSFLSPASHIDKTGVRHCLERNVLKLVPGFFKHVVGFAEVNPSSLFFPQSL